MPDNSSKLQNVQLPTEPGDSLAPRIMEPQGGDGGAILDSGIPSAAKEGVEGRACDCETLFKSSENGIFCRLSQLPHSSWQEDQEESLLLR